MRTPSIQNHNHLSLGLLMNLFQKGLNLLRFDIFRMQLKEGLEVRQIRTDFDSSTRRDTIMTIPTIMDRRFSARRPGSSYHRLQNKPTFIHPYNIPAIFPGYFLSLAIPVLATFGSQLHPAPWHAVLALGPSAPSPA